MKKVSLVLMLVLAMLFSMLPSGAALAKSSEPIVVNVRNRSGANVTLTLKSADGSKTLTLPEGAYNLSLTSGTYSYYAATACGTQTGVFSLTQPKQLFFFCNPAREIKIQKPSPPSLPEPVCASSAAIFHGHLLRRNTPGGPTPVVCSSPTAT